MATDDDAPASIAVFPCLLVDDPRAAIALYREVFGATEERVVETASGRMVSAELRIGASRLLLREGPISGQKRANQVVLHVIAEDIAAIRRTLAPDEGPTPSSVTREMDGVVTDAFGICWLLESSSEEAKTQPVASAVETDEIEATHVDSATQIDLSQLTAELGFSDEPTLASASKEDASVPGGARSQPRIRAIVPNHAPLGGGIVRVLGEGFLAGCAVAFGGGRVVAERISDAELCAVVPARELPGSVDVRVTNIDRGGDVAIHAFTFDTPPRIFDVIPAVASRVRGAALTLFGEGFSPECRVTIDGIEALPGAIDDDRLAILAPPRAHEGEATIVLRNPDGQSTTATLRYIDGPVLVAIHPPTVPPDGGVEVTLIGRGFERGCAVTLFDEIAVEAVFDDETCLRFVTPALERERFGRVRVRNPDGLDAVLDGAFRCAVAEPPLLLDITPSEGSVFGATRVVVTGSGFVPLSEVRLEGIAQPTSVESPTRLSFTTRAVEGAGPVDLSVENPDGQRTVLSKGFLFRTAPTPPKFIAAKPSHATTRGGATVRIVGENFDDRVVVRIGEVRTTARLLGATTLEVIVPPRHETGPVAIELIREDVVIRSEGAFVYERQPDIEVDDVSPNRGPTTGGTLVGIEGRHFPENLSVRIAGQLPKSMSVQNSERVVFITPKAASAQHVDIELIAPEGPPVVLRNVFRYEAHPAPELDSVSPVRGATSGGTELTLSGKHFAEGAVVLVGGKPATDVRRIDERTIETRTPKGTHGSLADVLVRNPDGKEATSRRAFLYDERYG